MRTLLLLVIALVLLAVFNPGEDDFRAFVQKHAGEMAGQQIGGGEVGRVLGSLGGSVAADAAMRVTRRDNYYVASVYTVDFDGPTGTANEWRFLGIATQFIELHRPDALTRGSGQ